jgi:hypothetical protein
MSDSQHDQSPGKRPHYTGLVQNLSIVKGNKGFPIHEIPGRKNIGEMGNDRKHKQSPGILGNVLRVVVALRYEITHNRASNAPDHMQHNRKPLLRISGKQQPSDMIDGHSNDRYKLYRIGI